MVKKRLTNKWIMNEERIKEAIAVLQMVANDNTTPRNIRKAARQAIDELQTDKTPGVRAAAAVHILDEISQDPNLPIYARLKIWNAVSILESVRD